MNGSRRGLGWGLVKTTGGCNLASALEFVSVVIKRKMDGPVRMCMNVIWMRVVFLVVPK